MGRSYRVRRAVYLRLCVEHGTATRLPGFWGKPASSPNLPHVASEQPGAAHPTMGRVGVNPSDGPPILSSNWSRGAWRRGQIFRKPSRQDLFSQKNEARKGSQKWSADHKNFLLFLAPQGSAPTANLASDLAGDRGQGEREVAGGLRPCPPAMPHEALQAPRSPGYMSTETLEASSEDSRATERTWVQNPWSGESAHGPGTLF